MHIIKAILKLFIFCFILVSCNKNDDDDISNQFIFQAEKGGELWNATKAGVFYDKEDNILNLSGRVEDPNYFQEEVVHISFNPDLILLGKKLRNFEATHYFVIGGDVATWRYVKTESLEESYIIINKFDTAAKQIIGTFEVRLKDENSNDDNFVYLANGEFSLYYEEYINVKF